jgi:PAS domain S-box-containing protein
LNCSNEMTDKIRVLLVEDVAFDAELITRVLAKSELDCDITLVGTRSAFESAISDQSFDIVLCDHKLPAFDSIEAIRLLKDAELQIPFILITSITGDELALAVARQEIDDYILKDRLRRLPSAITNLLQRYRLRQEKESAQSRVRFHIENNPLGYVEWDRDLCAKSISARATEILGWNQEDFSTARLNIYSLTHAQDINIITQSVNDLITGLVDKNTVEYRIVSKNGDVIWCQWFNSIWKDKDGKLVALMSLVQDITEQKSAQEELKGTTASYQKALAVLNKIMDSSLDVICSIDEFGNFVNVSSAAKHIWGYKPSELSGFSYMELVCVEDRPKTSVVAANIMNGTPVTIFENRYTHKNGSLIPMLWSANWDFETKTMYCVARDGREKKSLEQAFEMERKRFYDLFLQAPSAIGILRGSDHTFEMANPLYLDLIGKSNIIGKTVKEVIPEIAKQGFNEILDKVFMTGEQFSANEMLIQLVKNNVLTDIYLNFVYQPFRNKEGIIEGIFFFANNVTEQVTSRKLIEESESKYRLIVETTQEGIWMIDKDKRTTFVNPKLCDMLGYSNREMLGRESTFFMDEEGKKIATGSDYHTSNVDSQKVNIPLITKTGKKRWFTLSGATIRDEHGTYDGGLSMVTDITEKKNVEDKLKSEQNKLTEAQEIARLGSWELDFATNIGLWSPEACRIYGLQQNENEQTYQDWLSLIHPDDIERVLAAHEESAKTFADTPLEHRILLHDGTTRHIYSKSKFTFSPEGKVTGLYGIVHDITERKLAEEGKLKLMNAIVQRNKDLEQFTYIVSHNLRASVANIMGALNILEDDGLGADDKLILNQGLKESVSKLDGVVKDLNHILQVRSDISAGADKVNLAELVNDVKINLKDQISHGDVTIQTDFSELREMDTTKSYLHSIFFNLVSNSIKYRRQDQPCRIEIKSHKYNDKVALTFKDNGMGIDLNKRGDQVFVLYKRFHPGIEGKGLGLFMTKTQVESLGGKISIESEPGKGSVFTIEIKS